MSLSGTGHVNRSAASGTLRITLTIPRRGQDTLVIFVTGTPTDTPGEYVISVDPKSAMDIIATEAGVWR